MGLSPPALDTGKSKKWGGDYTIIQRLQNSSCNLREKHTSWIYDLLVLCPDIMALSPDPKVLI
nr:ALI_HP1_G0023540.mRNA.1.CDS.1 [Saccharomyces cerevisiae]